MHLASIRDPRTLLSLSDRFRSMVPFNITLRAIGRDSEINRARGMKDASNNVKFNRAERLPKSKYPDVTG